MDAATLSLLIGGGLTLITAMLTTVINAKLSEGKEKRAEGLKASLTRSSERVVALEKVYSDALTLLNLMKIKSDAATRGKDLVILTELFDQASRLIGLLELTSTHEIVDKFYDASLDVYE